MYNIADQHPDIVAKLTRLADAHKASFTIAESIFDKEK